jgi:glutamine---fructose-6-phosphate transaminase (isomerizing)
MCGIFGLIIKPATNYPAQAVRESLKKLAIFSESRGKDSSGIAIRQSKISTIRVVKGDIPIRELLKSNVYSREINNAIDDYEHGFGFSAFGHARLVTNGSQLYEFNNQPVVKNDIILIHNGIIVNVEDLWKQYSELGRDYSIDTEIIPALIRKEMQSSNDLVMVCNRALKILEGTYSIAAMFTDHDQFVLATNNGSLYYLTDENSFITFASEKYYLQQLKRESCYAAFSGGTEINQLPSESGLVVNMGTLHIDNFTISKNQQYIPLTKISAYKVQKHLLENEHKQEIIIDPANFINRSKEQYLYGLLEYNSEAISNLKRCLKCLLPETFPFIHYDNLGVCNYCNNYMPRNKHANMDKLRVLVEPYRRKNGEPDCIVPFSGGRDSTYSLHIIKRELGLNPIAFTYDWGMVTDLARRNIARVCGKLGIENIIVSADIHWKRDNIRKNILAWLKNPELGMIPLFMAGDKYFFYYTNKIKRQTGINLNIWGINYLENTEFKTGFAGVPPNFEKELIYSLSLFQQLKLFSFVIRNVIKSPSYINQSVFDSLGSIAARYISPKRDYFHLFDYYRWDEEEITQLLRNEYKWERAIDTSSTWRIGDGTASFYNYIYYTVAGFSEMDTFRSNQIREGMLDRTKGLELVHQENRPRYETLRWYLDIIGLDFTSVIKAINDIPKLYSLK